MPGEVRVKACLNASHHHDGLQLAIIVRVVHLRHLHVVLFENVERRRQDGADIRHARLDTLARVVPSHTVPFILRHVESLCIRITEARICLEDEQVVGHVERRAQG